MMKSTSLHVPYGSTGYFSRTVSDYLHREPALSPFYRHQPDIGGIKAAIAARKNFATPRTLLKEVLLDQYEGLPVSEQLAKNIALLENENTFTITTAHQPNIFTGPLYFIYKILHAVKLAAELNEQISDAHFVPVYYMGSEDADLDELGYINVGGQKLVWETKQTGAVGRMKVDKGLIKILNALHGQAGVLPHGEELISLLQQCYQEGKSIRQATLELVNALFGSYGLVVLIPDHAKLKTAFHDVVKKELEEGFSHRLVADTIERLKDNYKVQAGGRDINLFYLLDDKRERIEKDPQGDQYEVKALDLSFSKDEILQELQLHPERFSANVILRGAFQETVLPDVAFIGGGGELAYWLELKDVFDAVNVPYPVLVLRNSFLLLSEEQQHKIEALGFTPDELFHSEHELMNRLVQRHSDHQLQLTNEISEAENYYNKLAGMAGKIDATLIPHVKALQEKAVSRLQQLEKKMLRAEKSKFEIQQRQLQALCTQLFPNNSLQERVENMALWYGKYGRDWLKMIYDQSQGLQQEFTILTVAGH